MQIRVLGALETTVGGRWERVARSKNRLLLARLIIDRGSPVSVDALIDELWPAQPPAGAVNQIHVTVSRIRALLADREHTALVTRDAGYELLLAPDDLDVCRFEEVTADGLRCLESGDFATAVSRLSAALGLWRAPAFADVPQTDRVRAEADRLAEWRLRVQEARFDAQLGLGAGNELIPEIEAAVDAHPLREHLWEQLMLALYRSGRQADALLAYRRVYEQLDDELGVQPGAGLNHLQQRILDADPTLIPRASTIPRSIAPASSGPIAATQDTDADQPAPSEVPHQLPGAVADFTARRDELAKLHNWLDKADGVGDDTAEDPVIAPATLVVSGGGGLGKSTLCFHWAHQVADRFPDGQLYLDLRGFSDGPQLPVDQCLAALLRGIGVPPERVPVDVDEAAALYRSRLAGSRVLIMLDNVLEAGQVEPLLPGGGWSRALITSRDRLSRLTVRGVAQRLDLGPLDDWGIRRLLRRVAGRDRVDADPDALNELVRICAGLPLAARISAAQLAEDPHLSPGDQVRELRGGDAGGVRLSALSLDAISEEPQASIQAAFDLSYRRLDPPSARLFCLLGLVPGPDVSVEVAGALSGENDDQARRRLEGLRARGMLLGVGHRRYAMHDLLRAYAIQRCRADISGADRRQAERSLLDWYTVAVCAASAALPKFVQLPDRLPAVGSAREFAGPAEALAWLEAERANLRALVVAWADDGTHPVWQLTDVLRPFVYYRSHIGDALEIAGAGLRSAELAGNRRAAAAAVYGIAQAWRLAGRHHRAARYADHALELADESDWPAIMGSIWNDRGLSALEQGHPRDAVEPLRRAIESYRRAGDPALEYVPRNNLGVTTLMLGDLRAAAEEYCRMPADSGSRLSSRASNLGEIYLLMGQLDDARSQLELACSAERAAGKVFGAANAFSALGWLELECGHFDRAEDRLAEALELAGGDANRRDTAQTMIIRAQLRLATGDPDAAAADAQEAVRLTSDAGSAYETASALIVLAECQCSLGLPAEARAYAEQAAELAQEQEFRLQLGRALFVGARAAHQLADDESARRSAGRALELHRWCAYRRGVGEAEVFLAELAELASAV